MTGKVQPVTIINKRFTLRPYRKSDAESIAANISDRTIAKNLLALPYPYTLDDAIEWLHHQRIMRRRKNPDAVFMAIEIEGEVAGGVGLMKVKDHKAELGYWLARKYWGQGIMTEVVRETVRFAFRDLGLRRVYAHVFVYNKPSMRVLEKAGFKLEGKLIKNVSKNGRLLNEFVFAKVR